MSYCGPYTQSYNFTHMFNFTDLRGNLPIKKYRKGSIMYEIQNNPELTKFCYIVKLAVLENVLDNIQANFTIFIPIDSSITDDDKLVNMELGSARHIVLSSLLNDRMPSEILTDSPASFFNTMDPPNRLFVTNVDRMTRINENINIIQFDTICNNGIIHLVDRLIEPFEI